jgi:PilZ domain
VFDSRRSARLDVKLRAIYLTNDLVVDGLVDDLSRTGLFLHAPDCDDVGTKGVLMVSLPDREPVRLDAKVVRVEEHGRKGMALSFDEGATAHKVLANFMMKQHADLLG